jgi:hypothetical protein
MGGSGGNSGSAGAGELALSASHTVVGGRVSQSKRYRLVSTTVPGGSGSLSPSSARFVLREGVVGRVATSP